MQDPCLRLPLIRVFVHPWVLKFQKKYQIQRIVSPDVSEDDSYDYNSEDDDDFSDSSQHLSDHLSNGSDIKPVRTNESYHEMFEKTCD